MVGLSTQGTTSMPDAKPHRPDLAWSHLVRATGVVAGVPEPILPCGCDSRLGVGPGGLRLPRDEGSGLRLAGQGLGLVRPVRAAPVRGGRARVEFAYRCAQQVRSAYHQDSQAAVRRSRRRSSTPSTPAPSPKSPAKAGPCGSSAKRLWATSPLTAPAAAEPRPSVIDLHTRIARGFRNRDKCRLTMLLVGGGLLA